MNFNSKEDEAIFNNLCVANGVDRTYLSKECFKYEKLELFFSGFPRIIQLSAFPNLAHLVIINQPITVIENLDVCSNLVSLWICECEITDIEGLDQCGQIRNLYLYDNKISKIKNLYSLKLLEILWLNNNKIEVIEGLSELIILKELNLAGNAIHCVGNSLKDNISIEKLNLSGNKLEHTHDLLNLTKLPKLKYLNINGPDYPPNPVFSHTNFYLFIIYHFQNLKKLDTFDVNSSYLKEMVFNIMNKKKLFYNMKIESLERDVSFVKHKLRLNHNEMCKSYKKDQYNLIKIIKLNEMNLFYCNLDVTEHSTRKDRIFLRELKEINTRIKVLETKIESLETELEFYINKSEFYKTEIRSLFQMEFSSCGNFKFEYCSDKIWVNLCNELINSRFCNSEFGFDDFQQVKTHQVIKIKNYQVENNYSSTIKRLIDINDENEQVEFSNSKIHDYLFLCSDDDGKSLMPILNSLYGSSDKIIKLTNSVSNADLLRKQNKEFIKVHYGRIVIVKAFVGTVKENEDFNNLPDSVESSKYETVKVPFEKCSKRSNCLCLEYKYNWYFRTNQLLVPEYIVDFEYLTKSAIKSQFYYSYHGMKNESFPDDKVSLEFDNEINIVKKELESETFEKVAMILAGLKNDNLNNITAVNLTNANLETIPEISALLNLTELTMPFNKLFDLKDITNPKIKSLDVSYNQIQTLDEMHELPFLNNLFIQNNFLVNTKEEISILRCRCPNLINLNVKHNLFQKSQHLRWKIIGSLKQLQILNDIDIDENERKSAFNLVSNSKISEIDIANYGRTDTVKPRSLTISDEARILLNDSDNKIKFQSNDASKFLRITSLCVINRFLSKISNIEKLENLKYLTLSNNCITKIEGLDNLVHLEELILDNNAIVKIENLSKLQKLKKISLNENFINSVLFLKNLPNLQIISIHTNKLISFNGLDGCGNLMELYAANNCINDPSEISTLKSLNNLIIFDIQNNPITEISKNYRLNMIFNLKHLKGLDGVCVDSSEIFHSKDILGGRLNLEYISDKIGNEDYNALSELDLSNCCLKSVDLTPVEKLKNLRSLNLENNNLTSFSGLISLSNLKVLCLNSNSIESILPKSNKTAIMPLQKVEGVPKVYLKSLEVLHLGYNNIKTIAGLGLHDIPSLKALFLQGNDISMIDGLDYLSNLKEIVLDQNRIKSISENSFIHSGNLKEIHLDDNRLKNCTNVFHLKHLKRFYVGNNKISDLHDLDLFYSFESLIDVSLFGNPVSRRHQHRQYLIHMIPTLLMIDGIEISEDERLRVESNIEDNTDSNILPGILNRNQHLKPNSNFYCTNEFNKIEFFKGDNSGKKRTNGISSYSFNNKTNSIQLVANSKAVYFYDPIGQMETVPRLNFNKRK